MICAKIPFKKIDSNELTILVSGGTHPYATVALTMTIKKEDWKKDDEVWVEEWAESVTFFSGNLKEKVICEGRDVFISNIGPIQQMEHRYGYYTWAPKSRPKMQQICQSHSP